MKFLNTFAGVVCGSVMGVMLTACDKEARRKTFPLLQVSATTVHKGDVPITYEYAGRVSAFKDSSVHSRVGGILLRRNFIEGSRVTQGTLLFQIDPAPYEAEVAYQKALVAQTEAIYNQSARDATRADKLFQQKVQSKVLRDQAVAKRDTDAAALQQAQAALKKARLNLEYTNVTAQISGVIGRQLISEGSLIGSDFSSSLLTIITQTDPVYVNFSYTDFEGQEIRRLINDMNARGEKINNLKVKIHFGDGHDDYTKLGTIDFTSSTLDPATGTLEVRAIVNNSDNVLIPGQFVRVTIVGLKHSQAIAIPEIALLQDSAGTFVYLVDAEKNVEKRYVIVDRQLEDRRWLLKNDRVPICINPVSTDTQLPVNSRRNQATNHASSSQELATLDDNDIIITEGHFRINSAIEQLPRGHKLKVAITTLDGKSTTAQKENGTTELAK